MDALGKNQAGSRRVAGITQCLQALSRLSYTFSVNLSSKHGALMVDL